MSCNGFNAYKVDNNEEGDDDEDDDGLKLQLKMCTTKKHKERLSIFRNENITIDESFSINNNKSSSSATTTTNEILKRFNLTQQKKCVTPNIRFDVTLKPNLSIRGDRLKASKLSTVNVDEKKVYRNYHTINLCGGAGSSRHGNNNSKTNINYNKKISEPPLLKQDDNNNNNSSNKDKIYFSLPVHVRSRNRDQPSHQISVARHNSDLSRVHSPFTYIETYSIKRRYSLSPKSLIKKARIKLMKK